MKPSFEHFTVEPAGILNKLKTGITGIRFSSDGKQLAVVDSKRTYFWQLEQTGEWKPNVEIEGQGAFLGFFSAENQMLFLTEERYLLKFLQDGTALAPIQTHIQEPFGYLFSPDHRWFLTGNHQGQISLWNGHTFDFVDTFQIIPEEEISPYKQNLLSWMYGFQFTPDGQNLVFLGLSTQGFLHVCTFDSTRPMISRKAVLPQVRFNIMRLSLDGQIFAGSLSDENCVELYETSSLRRQTRLQTSEYPCYLAFSPDGAFLACATDDGSVSIWSLQNQQLIASFLAHPGMSEGITEPITALEWSPQGDFLITGGCDMYEPDFHLYDYSAKIWRIRK